MKSHCSGNQEIALSQHNLQLTHCVSLSKVFALSVAHLFINAWVKLGHVFLNSSVAAEFCFK